MPPDVLWHNCDASRDGILKSTSGGGWSKALPPGTEGGISPIKEFVSDKHVGIKKAGEEIIPGVKY